jgi:hypothetical protein
VICMYSVCLALQACTKMPSFEEVYVGSTTGVLLFSSQAFSSAVCSFQLASKPQAYQLLQRHSSSLLRCFFCSALHTSCYRSPLPAGLPAAFHSEFHICCS